MNFFSHLFHSRSWKASHNLIIGRKYHSSWETKDGVYLIGGGEHWRESDIGEENGPWNSTVLVKPFGIVEQGFNLKYPIE